MTAKEQLHLLVDELPESELAVARSLLEQLQAAAHDSVLRALLEAPVDDEPETQAEQDAIAEAYEDLAAGRTVSHESLKRELGL